jgi:hypothetical protein
MTQTIAENRWWENKKLTDEEKREMLIDACRKVFSTEEGKVVLNMLLDDLCFFDSALDRESDKYLNHYAKYFIRQRLGVRDIKSITDFIAETAAAGGGT